MSTRRSHHRLLLNNPKTTMAHDKVSTAEAACAALCRAYDSMADSDDAEAFAALFVENGEFERLGQTFAGRAAIAAIISSRPSGLQVRHVSRNIQIEVDPGAHSASGLLDMTVRRNHAGSGKQPEVVHAKFRDRYVLTDEGWRLSRRKLLSASQESAPQESAS